MFKSRFAKLVKSGQKRQTIRPIPRRERDIPKAGDCESWREWTGLPYRSPQRELAKVIIESVNIVTVKDSAIVTEAMAISDGFSSRKEMLEWFEAEHGLPFTGLLIKAK